MWAVINSLARSGLFTVISIGIYASQCTATMYMAYRNLRQGLAQQYAREWEARLVILHDEAVEEVEVLPLSVRPDMLYYTDLQYKDGYYWVNSSCATYYGKKSVDLIMPE